MRRDSDILHHVEIPGALAEICRVSSDGAAAVITEVYTHTQVDWIRNSRFVETFPYPRFRKVIYRNNKPYITEEERKLNEYDFELILKIFDEPMDIQYFNFFVNRVLSPKPYRFVEKLDTMMLNAHSGFGKLCAGRVLVAGRIKKCRGLTGPESH